MALGISQETRQRSSEPYNERSILLVIAENFDVRIAAHRNGTCRSPLYWDAEELEEAPPPLATVAAVDLSTCAQGATGHAWISIGGERWPCRSDYKNC